MKPNNHPVILTPGPVGVPSFIMEAIAQPVIHHRSDAFRKLFSELQAGLQYLFQTENPVLTLPGTGSFAVETAMRSLFGRGDQVAITSNGKFSERWLFFGKTMDLQVVPMREPWGEAMEAEFVESMFKMFPAIKGMVLTHCETSTGVQIDLEEMALAIKTLRPDVLVVVDTISTVGILPYYHDAWQVDVAISSAQKGLFNPAGNSFVALSPLALSSMDIPAGDDAAHLGHYWEYLSQGSFPFTPPTQMLYGILRALQEIQRETLPVRWNRTHQMSQFFKKSILELGGALFGQANCDSVTTFSLGAGDQDALRKEIFERGYELAGGQGPLKGDWMRVGHFGWIGMAEMEGLLRLIKDMKQEGKWEAK